MRYRSDNADREKGEREPPFEHQQQNGATHDHRGVAYDAHEIVDQHTTQLLAVGRKPRHEVTEPIAIEGRNRQLECVYDEVLPEVSGDEMPDTAGQKVAKKRERDRDGPECTEEKERVVDVCRRPGLGDQIQRPSPKPGHAQGGNGGEKCDGYRERQRPAVWREQALQACYGVALGHHS